MDEVWIVRGVVYAIIFGVGLLQLPLLVDVAANLLPQYDIKRWSNGVVGAILMVTCVAVATGGFYVWVNSVLPLWLHPAPLWSASGATHLLFGTWLWILTMTNYVAASTTPPGAAHALPPPAPGTAPPPPGTTARPTDGVLLESMRRPFYCRYCKAHRPPSAYHCHDCHACGSEVDHHCPFVNVCVGRDNYRYFLLFLCHGFLGMLYCAIITFPPFYQCWIASSFPAAVGATAHLSTVCGAHPEYTLVFLGPLGLGVAIGNLLGAQVVLLLGDVRTVDSLRYLRKTWNLWPILERAREGRGLSEGSALRTLVFSPTALWWHFVVPGRWVPQRGATKAD